MELVSGLGQNVLSIRAGRIQDFILRGKGRVEEGFLTAGIKNVSNAPRFMTINTNKNNSNNDKVIVRNYIGKNETCVGLTRRIQYSCMIID